VEHLDIGHAMMQIRTVLLANRGLGPRELKIHCDTEESDEPVSTVSVLNQTTAAFAQIL
jgi:hypothetical protein